MTSSPGRSAPKAALQTLRFLVGAVVGSLLLLGVAFSLILPFAPGSTLSYVVVLVVAAGAFVVLQTWGYRVEPVAPGLTPDASQTAGLRGFQTSVFRRLAVSESVAFVGIALGFVDRSIYPFYLGALITAVFMLMTVWPSRRNVERVTADLERDGARTGVREMLGFAPQDGLADGSR